MCLYGPCLCSDRVIWGVMCWQPCWLKLHPLEPLPACGLQPCCCVTVILASPRCGPTDQPHPRHRCGHLLPDSGPGGGHGVRRGPAAQPGRLHLLPGTAHVKMRAVYPCGCSVSLAPHNKRIIGPRIKAFYCRICRSRAVCGCDQA
jgi:hypothetical protein